MEKKKNLTYEITCIFFFISVTKEVLVQQIHCVAAEEIATQSFRNVWRKRERENRWKQSFFFSLSRSFKTPPHDEPWMHFLKLSSAFQDHCLAKRSRVQQLTQSSSPPPFTDMPFRWENVDGLWLAAFCSLFFFQWSHRLTARTL